ncbi:MAG: hypothetical protein IJ689_06880 [Alphaproteobacteria bacterium]|nr:hypothetical protein [Alphaproteobacteria bacterium]
MPFIVLASMLVAAIFWVDNSKIYRLFYTVLTLFVLLLIYNTFIIYTADFEFSPWRESGKVAYLVVVVEVLWLLSINAIMALLRRKIYIASDQLMIPFLSALVLGGYLIFYTSPPVWFCITGAVSSVLLFAGEVVLFFINFDKTIRGK